MAALHAGRLLARRYRLVDQIGSGGMSVIWRARDEVLDRIVALKVLAPSLAADTRFRDMVRVEARAAAQLVHPHVTAVHDYGETLAPDGSITSFVVMELLTGEELEDRLADGPLPWPEAVEIAAQVADALAAAHRLGIVHRDITPANVMMTRVGAKVLDFGIATQVGAPDEDEDGGTFGTPAYVAPERLDGAAAQPATDVYSLGVLLYETLTGRVPYPADTWEELSAALAQERPPAPLDVPGLPTEVARTCLRCLARDPHDRPTATQLATVLRDQLLPADPQAATMLSPTVTLPAIVVSPERPGPPAPAGRAEPVPVVTAGGAATGAGGRLDGATGAGGRVDDHAELDRGPRGRPGRWAVPVLVGTVVVAAFAALLLQLSDRGATPPPHALPTTQPVEPAPPAPKPSRSPTSAAPSPRAYSPPPPSPPSRRTPTSAPPTTRTPSASVVDAATRVDELIDSGVASGDIRDDVGTDLRNLLHNLDPGNGPEALADSVAQVRSKVAERRREGSITPVYARQLDAAIAELTTAPL